VNDGVEFRRMEPAFIEQDLIETQDALLLAVEQTDQSLQPLGGFLKYQIWLRVTGGGWLELSVRPATSQGLHPTASHSPMLFLIKLK